MLRNLTLLCAALILAAAASGSPDPPVPAEVTGTRQGRIESLVVDNFQTGTSRMRYFLHTSGETLELDARTVSPVKEHVSASAAPATCSATGEQRTAVILVSFPSKALLSSVTPALMQGSFFGAGRTLDNFLRESSFGQTWATGDVLGPFVLDADYFDQPLAIRDAALRAAAPSTDLTKYNRFFVVAPQGQSGMESGGMALLGCGQISSPQGNLYASSIWLGAESMVSQGGVVDVASHEIGHAFGLEHARSADYGERTPGADGADARALGRASRIRGFLLDDGTAVRAVGRAAQGVAGLAAGRHESSEL